MRHLVFLSHFFTRGKQSLRDLFLCERTVSPSKKNVPRKRGSALLRPRGLFGHCSVGGPCYLGGVHEEKCAFRTSLEAPSNSPWASLTPHPLFPDGAPHAAAPAPSRPNTQGKEPFGPGHRLKRITKKALTSFNYFKHVSEISQILFKILGQNSKGSDELKDLEMPFLKAFQTKVGNCCNGSEKADRDLFCDPRILLNA